MWISTDKYYLHKIKNIPKNHYTIYVPYETIWSQSRVSIFSKVLQKKTSIQT